MIALDGKRGYLLLTLLILLILLLIPVASLPCYAAEESAGWYHQDSGTTATLGAVAAADTSTAWAVGMEGTILKTVDGGDQWLPQESGTTLQLTDICAVDGNIAWAVGGDEVIGGAFIVLRTMNGGENWETIAEGTGFSLAVIEAVSAEVAWVGGFDGVISRTIDGGDHWSIQNTGTTSIITDISAVDANNAWAVGTAVDDYGKESGVILKTTDGGWNWTAQTDPYTQVSWTAVEAVDVNNVWVLGHVTSDPWVFPPIFGIFIKSSDGGASWISTIPCSYGFGTGLEISAADASTAWIVGPMDTAFNRNISKSTNEATTWACQEFPDPQVDLVDVSAASPEVAWAVGWEGTIVHTVDGGFTQPAPHIDAISPDSVKTDCLDPIQISITGSNFGVQPAIPAVAFGEWPILAYPWSDTEITFSVSPAMLYQSPPGQYEVTVTGEGGTSNAVLFTILEGLEVHEVQPESGIQLTLSMDCNLAGVDFKPGAAVRIENESATIGATSVNVMSHCHIAFSFSLFWAPPGVYDVVVTNADGSEARLEDAFTVTPVCGSGSGTAILMLGLTMGLLSLAGSSRLFKRKK